MKLFSLFVFMFVASWAYAKDTVPTSCNLDLIFQLKALDGGEALARMKALEADLYRIQKSNPQNPQDLATIRESIQRFKEEVRGRSEDPTVQAFINDHWHWVYSSTLDPIEEVLRKLPTKAELRPLADWEKTYRYGQPKDSPIQRHKVEVAEYMWVDNPEVQEILDQVHAMGGQVRHLQRMDSFKDNSQPPQFSYEPAYFWVNLGGKKTSASSNFIPVIATDLSQPYALSSLKHEFDHFLMWKEHYDRLKATGLDHETICRRLDREMGTSEYRRISEIRAVNVEVETERKYVGHPYMHPGKYLKPSEFFQFGYVHRMVYPDFEALRREISKKNLKDEKALPYMRDMVKLASDTRNRVNELPASFVDPQWEDKSIYDLILRPFNINRLDTQQSMERFQILLLIACDELGVSECIKPEDIVKRNRQQVSN